MMREKKVKGGEKKKKKKQRRQSHCRNRTYSSLSRRMSEVTGYFGYGLESVQPVHHAALGGARSI